MEMSVTLGRKINFSLLREVMTENNESVFEKLTREHGTDVGIIDESALESILEDSDMSSSAEDSLALSILNDLIDECTLSTLFEAHREMKLSNSLCQICRTRCRSYVQKIGVDIFGNSLQATNIPTYECVRCQKPYPSTRYAPHLEKCLGLAGRASSRVASRRLADRGSSSPFTPASQADDHVSDHSDGTYGEKKRKRMNGRASPGRIPKLKKKSGSALLTEEDRDVIYI
ncbi:uncharacterized protein VTP21DRAFT_6308 [Calcarisporiella thermophila]|uniref:uncharacterized protein n=1 Tax=Calcarisporiella thermophila TaxID=911321 RepID=UPI003743DDA6